MFSEVDQLEQTITCRDEKGRHSTVHVLRKQGSWTGSWIDIGVGPQKPDELQRFVLAEDPRRNISPVEGADAFEILDDGTIIRNIERPPRHSIG